MSRRGYGRAAQSRLRIDIAPTFKFIDLCECIADDDEPLFEAAERALIEEALYITKGNQSDAADILRTTKRILNYRLQVLGLRPIDKKNETKQGDEE